MRETEKLQILEFNFPETTDLVISNKMYRVYIYLRTPEIRVVEEFGTPRQLS